jgi:hypothetical protein
VDWTAQIFNYCERGLNPAFWAEPFNAISNAAFMFAAAFAYADYKKRERSNWAELTLITLVAVIGIGSFLFHTYATRWSAIADTAPIGIFMLAYIAFALRRFLNTPWVLVLALMAVFIVSLRWVGSMECGPDLLPITSAAGRSCLNGSLAYAPACVALAAISVVLWMKRNPVASILTLATSVFVASLTFRSLDIEVCAVSAILGQVRGTHALWHLLNGLLLYLLLRAAVTTPTRPGTFRETK